MKSILFFLIINCLLLYSCKTTKQKENPDSYNFANEIVNNKKELNSQNTFKYEMQNKIITIKVSYAAIECDCPQWFEDKYSNIPFLEGVDFFYLEPNKKNLTNANDLWDGKHLPLTLEVKGRFTKEKGLPITYRTKGTPERAKIFFYDSIKIISPQYKDLNPK